jgi:hypothetical protein
MKKNTDQGSVRARKNWKKASEVLGGISVGPSLGLSRHKYLLEKLDPKHRLGKQISPLFSVWVKSDAKENFFDWLDKKEQENKKPYQTIAYRVTDIERRKIRIEFNGEKILADGKEFSTLEFKGKKPQFGAFTFSKNSELFIAEHKLSGDTEPGNTHASLQGGRKVPAAGMIRIVNNKVTAISNFSGHYAPGLLHLYYAITHIPARFFSGDAKIYYTEHSFPLVNKHLKLFNKKLAHWFDGRPSLQTEHVMARDEFLLFARQRLNIRPKGPVLPVAGFKLPKDIENKIINIIQKNYLDKLKIVDEDFLGISKAVTSLSQFFVADAKITKTKDNEKVFSALTIQNKLRRIASIKYPARIRVKIIHNLINKYINEFNNDNGEFLKVLKFSIRFFESFYAPKPIIKPVDNSSLEFDIIKQNLQEGVRSRYSSSRFESSRINSSQGMGYVKNVVREIFVDPQANGGEDELFMIEKIEGLQNERLFENYSHKKEEIKRELGDIKSTVKLENVCLFADKLDRSVREFFLYHGTSEEKSTRILSDGFNPGNCVYSNLTGYGPLGRGIYFTDNISKATLFSKCNLCNKCSCSCVNTDGLSLPKVLLVCKVILGNPNTIFTKDIEIRHRETCIEGTHSTIGLKTEGGDFRSNEICISNKDQILPYYRVYYRLVKNLLKIKVFDQEAQKLGLTDTENFLALRIFIEKLGKICPLSGKEKWLACLNQIKVVIQSIREASSEQTTVLQFINNLETQINYYRERQISSNNHSSLFFGSYPLKSKETTLPKEREEEKEVKESETSLEKSLQSVDQNLEKQADFCDDWQLIAEDDYRSLLFGSNSEEEKGKGKKVKEPETSLEKDLQQCPQSGEELIITEDYSFLFFGSYPQSNKSTTTQETRENNTTFSGASLT